MNLQNQFEKHPLKSHFPHRNIETVIKTNGNSTTENRKDLINYASPTLYNTLNGIPASFAYTLVE